MKKGIPNIGYVPSNILTGLKLIRSKSELVSVYFLSEPYIAKLLIPFFEIPSRRLYAIFSKPPITGGKKCVIDMKS